MNGKEIGKMISLCCRDTKQPYKLNSVQANSIKKWLVLELVKIDGWLHMPLLQGNYISGKKRNREKEEQGSLPCLCDWPNQSGEPTKFSLEWVGHVWSTMIGCPRDWQKCCSKSAIHTPLSSFINYFLLDNET